MGMGMATQLGLNSVYPDPMKKVSDPDGQKSIDPTGSGSSSLSLIHHYFCFGIYWITGIIRYPSLSGRISKSVSADRCPTS